MIMEISEHDCNTVMSIDEMDNTTQGRIYRAIVNGTPLPPGH